MRMGDNIVIVTTFIKEHLPEGLTLADLAKDSAKHPWLVEIVAHLEGHRRSITGNVDIAAGQCELSTVAPPMVAAKADASRLILPNKLMEWVIKKLEQNGQLAGHIKIGVQPARRANLQYSWVGDFEESEVPF
jgi:hypothetical protein